MGLCISYLRADVNLPPHKKGKKLLGGGLMSTVSHYLLYLTQCCVVRSHVWISTDLGARGPWIINFEREVSEARKYAPRHKVSLWNVKKSLRAAVGLMRILILLQSLGMCTKTFLIRPQVGTPPNCTPLNFGSYKFLWGDYWWLSMVLLQLMKMGSSFTVTRAIREGYY